ncbi:SRPBCC domain-containing protein [Phenylobacterium sp.]|uniref:SRPBCC domain-containing protein n=1 Tax=Phenylobacterium sp. TaxID=1871053 RepID=UPI002DE84126|nr:SRPBCC domain-containing protein [Phenylobacterium sp.]
MDLADSARRRRLLQGGLVAGMTAGCAAARAAPAMAVEAKSTGADFKKTFLRQAVLLPASPRRIYEILLDARQFAAVTGAPAQIDPRPGGAFSLFGGLIAGRNVELAPYRFITQAWRTTAEWGPGVYSLVRFGFAPKGAATLVTLDHTGFQEGDFGHLNAGWPLRYWDPLRAYLKP